MSASSHGQVWKAADGYAVRFERIFAYDVMTVWDAITNPEKIALWFMNMDIDLSPGGKIVFRFGDEESTYMYGRVIRAEPGKVFEYIWENTDGPDEHALWELFPEGDAHCRLVFTYSRLNDKYAISVPAGWHVGLDFLQEVLDGRTTPPGEYQQKQQVLHQQYEAIIKKDMNTAPFTIERTFNAPAQKVWEAITDRTKMKEWYFDLDTFEARPGFEFQFTGGPDDGPQYLHLCKVTEVIPGKKLTYSWRYDGYEGESFVTWELFPEGDKTKLKLTHAGLETFPADNKDLAPENFAAGWTDIIGRLLKEYLER